MRLLHALLLLLLAALGGGGGGGVGVLAIYIGQDANVTTDQSTFSLRVLESGQEEAFAASTNITIQSSTNVTIEALISTTVTHLDILTGVSEDSTIDYGITRAFLTVTDDAFTSLDHLNELLLHVINFTETNLTLAIPSSVTYLQVANSNALDVSLEVSNDSKLSQVDFGYNEFTSFPRCLYERKYNQRVEVKNINITTTGVFELNETEYDNFRHNLNPTFESFTTAGQYNISFTGNCSASSSSTSSSAIAAGSASSGHNPSVGSNDTTSSESGNSTVTVPTSSSPSPTTSPSRRRMLASLGPSIFVCSSGNSSSSSTPSSSSPSPSPVDANSGNKHKSSSKSWVYILVAVCAVVLVIAASVYQRKRKSTRKGNQLSTMGTSSLDDSINGASVNLIGKDEGTPAAGKLTFISGDDLLRNVRLEPSEVSLNKPIGSGRLFTGTYRSSKVIIKRAEAAVTETAVTKQLMAQAKLLAQLSHPNLVQLVGVAWVAGTDFAIVTEFVPKGNLRAVLTKSRADLTMRMKLNMCIDIAQALAYLHSADCSVYVQNLSTSKVLVADDFQCKVNLLACQSLSTPMVSKHDSVSDSYGTGDVAWLAPEIITRSAPLVPRAVNIYAFGVLMCEIFSDALPYQSLINEMGNTLSDVEIVQRIRRQQVVVPHENSQTYMSTPVKVRDMIDGCLSSTPLSRPSAEDIVKCLMAIRLDDDNAPQASS